MLNRDENKIKERLPFTTKMVPSDDDEIDVRPTVLLIGINAPTYSSRGILKGIEALGYRPEFLDWQRIKMNEGIGGLRDRVLAKASFCSPEFIICHIQNPEAMLPLTFAALNDIAPVVNLTFDCRAEIDWYKEVAPLISLTCFSNEEDVRECAKEGINNTISLHSSCNYDFYKPADNHSPPREISAYSHEIIFLGGNYSNSNVDFPLAQNRQDMIAFLKENYGDKFLSIGMGQEVSKYVNEYEELELYRSAKIVVGHNNFLRENYSSDRLWRAMGAGAFFLSPYSPGVEKTFEREIHIDWFNNLFELKNLIDFYLSNDFERNSIAQLGCTEVRLNHRWQDRIKVMADYLKLSNHE